MPLSADKSCADTSVTWEKWQIAPDGKAARLYHLVNKRGTKMSLCDWGATLVSFKLAMPDGSLREMVLGCDRLDDYLRQSAYLGATVGRYANRIGGAQFVIDGQRFLVDANDGENCLHGGEFGFHNRRWLSGISEQNGHSVRFSLISEHGDQGFPGNAEISVTYHLTDNDELVIDFEATVDQACPINLTNHAYFNLDGLAGDIGSHILRINADHYQPVNSTGIPDAAPQSVSDTPFDFRQEKSLNRDWRLTVDDEGIKHRGYDHSFVIDNPNDDVNPAAQVYSGDGLVSMDMFTTKPAIQLYTGQYLEGTIGHNELLYQNRDGFCLEAQFLPDSPNMSEDCVVRPGDVYAHQTRYRFYCSEAD